MQQAEFSHVGDGYAVPAKPEAEIDVFPIDEESLIQQANLFQHRTADPQATPRGEIDRFRREAGRRVVAVMQVGEHPVFLDAAAGVPGLRGIITQHHPRGDDLGRGRLPRGREPAQEIALKHDVIVDQHHKPGAVGQCRPHALVGGLGETEIVGVAQQHYARIVPPGRDVGRAVRAGIVDHIEPPIPHFLRLQAVEKIRQAILAPVEDRDERDITGRRRNHGVLLLFDTMRMGGRRTARSSGKMQYRAAPAQPPYAGFGTGRNVSGMNSRNATPAIAAQNAIVTNPAL